MTQFLGKNAVEAFEEATKMGIIPESPLQKSAKKLLGANDELMQKQDVCDDCVICGGRCEEPCAAMDDPFSGESICRKCLEDLLRQEFFQDLEPEDLAALKERVFHAIEESPYLLLSIAAELAATGDIIVEDLI
jgi:hypothetical protein